MKTDIRDPCDCWCANAWYNKKGYGRKHQDSNSERAPVTASQKISMMGSAQILRKVLNV